LSAAINREFCSSYRVVDSIELCTARPRTSS
jgi:hypothetical protein